MKKTALVSLALVSLILITGCPNWLNTSDPNANNNSNTNSNENNNQNENDNTDSGAPSITGFSPSSGQAELKPLVTVSGTNLDTATGAMIGDQEAVILGQNPDDMLIELPETSTTGFISVVNPDGTAVSDTEFMIVDLDPMEAASLTLGAMAEVAGMAADSTLEADDILEAFRSQDQGQTGAEDEDLNPNAIGALQLLASLYSVDSIRHGAIESEESQMNEVIENLVKIAIDRYSSGKIWTSGEINVYYNPDCIRGVVLQATDFEYLSLEFPFEVRSCVDGGAITVEISGTLHLADNRIQIWFEGSVSKTSEQIIINGTGAMTLAGEDYYFECQEVAISSGDKMPSSGKLIIGSPPIAEIEFTEETPATGNVIITTEGETFEQLLPDPVTGYSSDPDIYNYTGLWTTSSARANPTRYQELWEIEETGEFSFTQAEDSLSAMIQSGEGLPEDLEDKIEELKETAEQYMGEGYDPQQQSEDILENIEDFFEKFNEINEMFDAETISGLYLYSDRNYPDRYTLGLFFGKAVGPRAYAFYTETTYLKPNEVDPVIEYGQTGVLELFMENEKAFSVQAYTMFPYSNYQGLVLPWDEYCMRTGLNVELEVNLEEGTISFGGYFSN